MITLFTFFLTIAIYHIVVGTTLIALTLMCFRWMDVAPETKSWIWVSIFALTTVIPLSLLNQEGVNQRSVSGAQVIVAEQLPQQSENSPAVKVTLPTPQWHVPSEFVRGVTDILVVLCVVWLLGTLWRALQILMAAYRSHQLRQAAYKSELYPDGFKEYRVLQSQIAQSPMIIGVTKPVIVLPQSMADSLSTTQLKPILLHEVAHIERHDMPIGVIQELLAILFWWSPIIRIINQKIHLTRELSCDLRAASQLDDPKTYAHSLVEATRMMLLQRKNILAMGLFSKKSELTQRVDTVLNSREHGKPNVLKTLAICAAISSATIVSANQFAPGINVDEVKRDANHFSKLSEFDSDRVVNAMSRRNPDALVDLIDRGLNINVPIVGDGTPLIIAVRANNRSMVEALIANGADVNQSAEGDGNPLIAAARSNYMDLAMMLVDQGADVNAIVRSDETPLIQASWNGHFEMVEYLVNQGADVNLGVMANELTNPEWRSPLNKASSRKIREFLIANGAVEE